MSFNNSIIWKARITLDGEDISSICFGKMNISMEEGTPRRATFMYQPPSGNIPYCSLKNKPVTIDYINTVVGATFRVFTGEVEAFSYDPTNRVITINADDRLHDTVDEMDRTALENLIGGLWSEDVFDEDVDNWEYAEDLLSTVPKSLDKSPAGGLRVTNWAAKGTADVVLTSDQIQYRSPTVSFADSSTLINYIDVDISNRFARSWHREVVIGWRYPRTMCEYVAASTELPSREMAIGAINSGGWGVKSFSSTPVPNSGAYYCRGNGLIPIPNGDISTASPQGSFIWRNPYYPDLLFAFSAVVYKDWDQEITERGSFVVKAPQSIENCGESKSDLVVNVDVTSDEEQDTQDDANIGAVTSRFSSIDSGGCGIADQLGLFTTPGEQPPQGGYGVARVGASSIGNPSAGSSATIHGDYILDQEDADRYEAAAKIAMAQARNTILSSHRQNFVSFTRNFLPADTDMTIEVNVPNVHARGKVYSVNHAMDIDSGAVVSSISISVSKSSDTAVTEQVWLGSDWVLPPRPENESYISDVQEHNKSVQLYTQLGNKEGESKAYCEDQLGFSGNYHYKSIVVAGSIQDAITSEIIKDEDGNIVKSLPEKGPIPTTWTNTELGRLATEDLVLGEPWPHRLTVEVDDVQEELTDAVEVETSGEYTTQIPNELLDIN